MTLATLIVAALGASFTALAAGAALWTARTGRDEARLRAQPYVAAGPPVISLSGDEVEIGLKNLGLGPARLLAILLECNGQAIGAYTSPGLAPMEAETIAVPMTLWTAVDPPLDRIWVSGQCEDAMAQSQPLYVQGEARMADRDAVERGEESSLGSEAFLRHQLKPVVRAARTDNSSATTAAWMHYWQAVEAADLPPAAVDEQVRSFWLELGGPDDRYTSRANLILTEADRRRHESATSSGA